MNEKGTNARINLEVIYYLQTKISKETNSNSTAKMFDVISSHQQFNYSVKHFSDELMNMVY